MNMGQTLKRIITILTFIGLLFATGNLTYAQYLHDPPLFSPVDPPRSDYDITCSVEFDSTSAIFSGFETISLKNTSDLPLSRLNIKWPSDSLQTLTIKADGRAVEILNANLDSNLDNNIIVELAKPLLPGKKLEIIAQFSRKFIFEPDDDKHLWTNWYPRIYWGMQAQDNFKVQINNKSSLTLATSGVYDHGSDTYRAEGIREFGLYFLKDAVITENTIAGVDVKVIHTPAASECANLIIETAADVIAYYKKRFGFYPSKNLVIAQGVDSPNGGYPAATNLVVIHGMEKLSERNELHWRWITAHEIGHQYWNEYIMPEPPDQIGWLMIGLGIYVDREYTRYSGLAPDRHIGLMKRYTDGARKGLDTRADVYSDYLEDIGFDFNNVVIHGKGYSIISALNCVLGDELFDLIHSKCLHEFAGKRMGFYDFQKVCEIESGQDLSWFFDQWVRSNRFVAYEIKSTQCNPENGKYISVITVEKAGTLDMPVPVTAYFSDNTSQTKFTGRMQQVNKLIFESMTTLDSAIIDANNEIAMIIPPLDTKEMAVIKRVTTLPSRVAIDSLPIITEQILNMDIDQTLFWGQLGRMLYDWGFYDEALSVFKRRTTLLENLNSEWVVSAYGWQGLLLDLLDRRDEAIDAYKKALETETEQEFSYKGDPVIINREWLKERILKPYIVTNVE